jgi:hypothetical protein
LANYDFSRTPSYYTTATFEVESKVGLTVLTLPNSNTIPNPLWDLDSDEPKPEPLSDVRAAIARLIALKLPPDIAAGTFDEDYYVERERFASALAELLLKNTRIVYESSPLSVHDLVELVNTASAYSLNVPDGPVVLLEHIGNWIVLGVTSGVSLGLSKGVAKWVEHMFRFPKKRSRRRRW